MSESGQVAMAICLAISGCATVVLSLFLLFARWEITNLKEQLNWRKQYTKYVKPLSDSDIQDSLNRLRGIMNVQNKGPLIPANKLDKVISIMESTDDEDTTG